MKTIRQIAEEIGVSKQAVYKRYKGKLQKAIRPHEKKIDGTVYILEQGESIIKQDFSPRTAYGGAHTEYTLNVTISMLQKELEIKNKQIAELTNIINKQIRKSNNYRKFYFNKKATKQKETAIPIKRLYKGQNTLN